MSKKTKKIVTRSFYQKLQDRGYILVFIGKRNTYVYKDGLHRIPNTVSTSKHPLERWSGCYIWPLSKNNTALLPYFFEIL